MAIFVVAGFTPFDNLDIGKAHLCTPSTRDEIAEMIQTSP